MTCTECDTVPYATLDRDAKWLAEAATTLQHKPIELAQYESHRDVLLRLTDEQRDALDVRVRPKYQVEEELDEAAEVYAARLIELAARAKARQRLGSKR